MKTLKDLQPLIIQWAKEKNIHLPECIPKQRLKLIEECGELASAILKNDIEKQKDAIGDIFVVLVIYAEQTDGRYIDFFCGSEYNTFNDYDCDLISNTIRYSDELDSLFWLYAICHKSNLDLTECANIAWNEIKDRKGSTINGTFIKN